jgi:hypothetical protein
MTTHRARGLIVTGALALGIAAGAAGVAGAATGRSAHRPPGGAMGNPVQMSHGPGETLLTGSAAASAKAAALHAVPGATVIRVETDSGPGAYEAHLRKPDGTYVTVKLDRSFHVTGTQSGFGSGGPRPGPGGAAA